MAGYCGNLGIATDGLVLKVDTFNKKCYNSDSIIDTCIVCWEFDDTVITSPQYLKDSTGYRNARVYNTVTMNQTGLMNQCIQSYTNSYVRLSTEPLAAANKPMTWNSWIKFNTIGSYIRIFGKDNGSSIGEYALTKYGSYYYFYISDGNSFSLITPTNSIRISGTWSNLGIVTGQWYMFTLTYDGGTSPTGIKFYLNGTLVTTTTETFGTFSGAITTSADFDFSTAYDYYGVDGWRDQFSMFSKELTQDQITYLYNSGQGIKYIDWNA